VQLVTAIVTGAGHLDPDPALCDRLRQLAFNPEATAALGRDLYGDRLGINPNFEGFSVSVLGSGERETVHTGYLCIPSWEFLEEMGGRAMSDKGPMMSGNPGITAGGDQQYENKQAKGDGSRHGDRSHSVGDSSKDSAPDGEKHAKSISAGFMSSESCTTDCFSYCARVIDWGLVYWQGRPLMLESPGFSGGLANQTTARLLAPNLRKPPSIRLAVPSIKLCERQDKYFMKVDQTLAKVFKFVTFVFFTFTALLYVGVLVLLPLDVLFQIVRIFHAIGLPTAIAALLGIGAVGYIGIEISKMPALCQLIVDIGKQLVDFGHSQIKRCDSLIEETRGADA
jgi:hypothetical protein